MRAIIIELRSRLFLSTSQQSSLLSSNQAT